MTLLDILLCWMIFIGWKKGVVRELATLAGVLLGLWASVHLSQQVAPMLGLGGESAVLIAFIVIFLAALVVAYLMGKLVESIMKAVKLSVVNRLLGAVLGACKALVVLSILLSFVLMIDTNSMLISQDVRQRSVLFRPVSDAGNRLTAQIKNYIAQHKDEWKEALQ